MNTQIRAATPLDAQAIAEIYAPAVLEGATSFELQAPSAEIMSERIQANENTHPWLVLEDSGSVIGYAYAAPFRRRAAYRWTVESSVYIHPQHTRRAAGKALMTALLAALREAGYHTAIAGATLPNPGSIALHEGLGFQHVGSFAEVGNKNGAWHSVGFWNLRLSRENAKTACEPRACAEVLTSTRWLEEAKQAAQLLRPRQS